MIKSDFLVIGSGIAGLNFALQASAYGRVCLVTKKEAIDSNTNFAQGGIAAVFSEADNFDLHVKDTLKAGDGLCDRKAVWIMVKQAPEEIESLMSIGANFDKKTKGPGLELGREGGHSRKRIVHRGDLTGAEVEKALVKAARKDRNIRIFRNHLAFELITKDGRCIGARVLDNKRSRVVDFFARATALATGGLCEIYENTSNPPIATGDGVAMGFRAGCEVENMEFVQFHPTALRRKGMPFFLISEAVRGEGGILKNTEGKRFVDELAFRDEVVRAMFKETEKRKVYLDITRKDPDFLMRRFPVIYGTCLDNGIDMTKQPIPVEPVAHYACGGIATDADGRTNVPGLYAIGEVACTGVHGANRLASNSLLESLVFSSRAVESARAYAKKTGIDFTNTSRKRVVEAWPYEIRSELKNAMWKHAGIMRSAEGLGKALEKIKDLQRRLREEYGDGINAELIEARNMLLVAKLIAYAALMRVESRGGHFREDFPEKSEEWERNIVLCLFAKNFKYPGQV